MKKISLICDLQEIREELYENILILEIINSPNFEEKYKTNNIFKITQNGLLYSQRENKEDTYVYLGYQTNEEEIKRTIDILINPDTGLSDTQQNIGQYAMIFYNDVDFNYYIKDLNCGLGTFYKLKNSFIIKECSLINIGETYINFDFPEEGKNTTMKVTLLKNNNVSKEYTFNSGDINEIITIGRGSSCKISIKDEMLSRVHCYVKFIDNNWLIFDGKEDGSKSTNGTWIYASVETEIYDGMMFKCNQTLFECKYA